MNRKFSLLPLVAVIAASWAAQAKQVAYSPDMIRALVPNGQDIDMAYFEKGYQITPGAYRFTVKVNGDFYSVGTYEVRDLDGSLQPVIHAKDLKALPLKDEVLKQFVAMEDNEEVFPLSSKIEGATTQIHASDMTIELFIPQIFVVENVDWVDVASPDLWDYGETGAVVNYNMTANHTRGRQFDTEYNNFYANINGHLNIGAWRLYSSGAFNVQNQKYEGESLNNHSWDLWNTYLKRDLPKITGTLKIGEINTSSEIFDSVPLRGFNVATNEQMLPRRDRTYAPIIEGVANTNAQILIRQNGHIVHTINVAAGPFRLENLPSFGNYGDLEVVIREADGTERVTLVPYSSVPNMLREGQFRYDFSAGRYYYRHMPTDTLNTGVLKGTLAYGLPHDITVYGGALLAKNYIALALGTGLSLGQYGALAADVIQSNHKEDQKRGVEGGSGAAWRIRYEKTLTSTGTTVNLANYQYITGNYASLRDYAEYGTIGSSVWWGQGKMRSRWQLSLSQNLAQFGSLSVGAHYATYHGNASDVKAFNVGYNTSVGGISVGINYSRDYQQIGSIGERHWDSSHTVMLNLNIPLDLFFKNSTSSLIKNTDLGYQGRMEKSYDGDRRYQQSVVMSGNSEDLDWSWYFSQELGSSEDRSTSISVNYVGDRFTANAGYDHSHMADNYSLGINGAMVFHKTGITTSAAIYDSVAIVDVNGLAGVKTTNGFDNETDFFGHSTLSYLTNYTKNEISIDPATLPDGAMLLDSTDRIVIPTSDAIVRVDYPVRMGKQAVFILKRDQGTFLPFGSTVRMLGEGEKIDPYVSGIVGEGGRVYLTGLPSNGVLVIETKGHRELFEYELPAADKPVADGFINVPTLILTPKINEMD